MKKKTLLIGLGSLMALGIVGVSSAYFTARILVKENAQQQYATPINQPQVKLTNLSGDGSPIDFTYAAEQTVNAVVHVQTYAKQSSRYGSYGRSQDPFWDFFFGDPDSFGDRYYDNREQQKNNNEKEPELALRGSGSGVIISADGYVVTNNHVIDKAAEIEVTLNDKQKYKATLVGADPSTDIALLKIEEENLHHLTFGSSDNLKVGEWVLAVGNPYNLTSTVTAGIVSAKSRSLGILPSEMSIESFIQTDAAVNRGNSGGALVNTGGELVGINTAIASASGDFIGLSFAVPSSIVHKVVEDIKEYGIVQRALLGVRMVNLNAETAKEFKVDTRDYNGVLITEVIEGNAAEEAGMKANDIITAINGVTVKSSSDVQEQISLYRPGDKVNISIIRDGKVKQIDAVLRNQAGNTDPVKSTEELIASLGATFKELTAKEKEQVNVKNGVQVVEVKKGKLQEAGVRKGFTITRVNKRAISSINDLREALKNVEGAVLIEGIYPNGSAGAYALSL